MRGGADGHTGLPVPSPSLQEPFKTPASAGGLTGSEGACLCHRETEPTPSQPQLESGGKSPEEDRQKAQEGLKINPSKNGEGGWGGKRKIRYRKRLNGQQVLGR